MLTLTRRAAARLGAAAFVLAAVTSVNRPVLAQEAKSPVKKVGKYAIELRVPAEGLFAEEVVDVEFRVTDTTNEDPVLGGTPVVRAKVMADIIMPAMPTMPRQKPKTHAEGVPGDYGVEAFFPHGGEYQLDLTITPQGEPKAFTASFKLSVQDAPDPKKRKPKPKPFTVEILDRPQAKAGQPVPLRLAVRDTKTKEVIKDFDEAHTQLFHLILVSRDLGWFAHEHPVQQPDGTFTIDQTFPAGGDYLVFADVAPRGAGSQVLPTSLKVQGGAPDWESKLKDTPRTVTVEGLKADLSFAEKAVPIGRSTTLTFTLSDAGTGKALTDLEPYLGAMGHLILIHEDGGTFVHSHPAEDEASTAKAKAGSVSFLARFPKPGTYKAWGQFQRQGKVVTLPFVVTVKGGAK